MLQCLAQQVGGRREILKDIKASSCWPSEPSRLLLGGKQKRELKEAMKRKEEEERFSMGQEMWRNKIWEYKILKEGRVRNKSNDILHIYIRLNFI